MPVFDIYDDNTSRRIELDARRITFGRSSDNSIYVDDRQCSRRQCEVRISEVGHLLRDLDSSNGTKLNNQLIDRPMSLRDGDEIGIGKAVIRFWTSLAKITKDNAKLQVVKPEEQQRTSVALEVEFLSSSKAPSGGHAGVKSEGAKVRPPAAPTPKPSAKPVVVEPTPKPAAPAAKPAAAPTAAKPRAAQPKTQPKTPPKTPAKSPEMAPIPLEPDENESSLQLVESDIAPEALITDASGPLTLNHIIPLSREGKPAHAVGKDASEVSSAMLRLKQLFLRAFQLAASDIHVEPKETQLQVRYRIDGVLHTSGALDFETAKSVYSIVKLLCNLDINKKGILQDGGFAIQLPDRRVDLRVSIAPSTQGDKMVVRILDRNLAPKGLGDLGMDPYILEQLRRRAHQESSMIITCGPTGSGKTTTMYAIIRELNALQKNIVTVEDPVEYKLDNITQIQANARMNITFASALTSLLRQDPDVIFVGEIRDADTARMAVQSAMTGHLVLTTVHARDSLGSIFRLLDLGVEPFLLANALTLVLSQRLMRQLCSRCKMKYKATIRDLSRAGIDELAGTDMYAAVGCDECLGLGYKGRQAIFELMTVNDQVRDAIANKPTIQQLRTAAGDWIFQTLREDGVRKLKAGLTSLEEFTAVAAKD